MSNEYYKFHSKHQSCGIVYSSFMNNFLFQKIAIIESNILLRVDFEIALKPKAFKGFLLRLLHFLFKIYEYIILC